MNVYTYYENVGFEKQNELVELWELSWRNQGFNPIVLTLKDAKKHSYYSEFKKEIKDVFLEITDKKLTDYGMSCWNRWLAYATQPNKKFYVSDYDAINVSFEPTDPSDKLHLMDNHCPFLASGTPIQFENLCKLFVRITKERVSILKKIKTLKHTWYHDQEFFLYNLMPNNNPNAEELRRHNNILMTQDRARFGGPDFFANSSVYHVSHYMTKQTKKRVDKYKNLEDLEARINIIKDLLK